MPPYHASFRPSMSPQRAPAPAVAAADTCWHGACAPLAMKQNTFKTEEEKEARRGEVKMFRLAADGR